MYNAYGFESIIDICLHDGSFVVLCLPKKIGKKNGKSSKDFQIKQNFYVASF